MNFPKFLVADNTDLPEAVYIVHTEFPSFILNLENDEVKWLDDIGDESEDGLTKILGSYGEVVDRQFKNPHLKSALLWMAAQSGPTPDQAATGDFVGWQAMLHESGAKHPRGGSGMLTQAMKKYLEAHGGQVIAESPVEKIIIKNFPIIIIYKFSDYIIYITRF